MDILSNFNYLKRVILYSLSNQKVQIFLLPTVIYTNWTEGSPKNITDHCMQTDESSVGKWSDVLCNKKIWLYVRRCKPCHSLSCKKSFLMLKNLVQIGFIYAQLPKEKPPTEIWPWMTWNDVSSAYAGAISWCLEWQSCKW
jgi:hypothetical protein